eukprot:TRINITY_DN66445_c0_g1_i1.p2 TRINITY_DN66445_c0_g1~~TRINITY_DN66445_c0_g1_i1.p2  ORF type:complete len:221 (+),score=35.35 TRINITY_DN66445_c0_g1_i1:382-1044(+)
MKLSQVVNLKHIKIPQCLPQFIGQCFIGIVCGKLRKVLPLNPVHGYKTLRRQLTIVIRETQMRNIAAMLYGFEALLHLKQVIGLIEQLFLHLFKIHIRAFSAYVKQFHGHGLYHCQIAADTLRNTGILDFYGQVFSILAGFVHLPNAGAMHRFGVKFIKQLGRCFTLSLIHISEPTRPLYISYAVFCLKKKKTSQIQKKQKNIQITYIKQKIKYTKIKEK